MQSLLLDRSSIEADVRRVLAGLDRVEAQLIAMRQSADALLTKLNDHDQERPCPTADPPH